MAKSESSRAEYRIATAVHASLRVIETNDLEDIDAAALVPVADAAEALLKSLESLAESLS